MTAERDPYVILGVPPDASADAVAGAYRTLARMHHPDVSRITGAEQRMAEINAAWTVLRDPAKRAAWDRAHGITPATATGATAGGAPAAPRTGGGAASPTGGSRGRTTAWRRGPGGEGAAGPPPGNPRGSVLPFGRHIGWSLGEIARVDPGYLVWLEGRDEGAPYRDEIGRILEGLRLRTADPTQASNGKQRGRGR